MSTQDAKSIAAVERLRKLRESMKDVDEAEVDAAVAAALQDLESDAEDRRVASGKKSSAVSSENE